MDFAACLREWVTRDHPIKGDMATFVIELSIANAFPRSHALQDAARDVLRSAAHGTKPSDKSVYGSGSGISTDIYHAVKAESADVLKCWGVFLDFGDSIPQSGLTASQVEVINERIYKAKRQAVAQAENGQEG